MLHEYYRVIQDLARYEFGNGIYTNPANDSQVFQVENLQLRIAEHYPRSDRFSHQTGGPPKLAFREHTQTRSFRSCGRGTCQMFVN